MARGVEIRGLGDVQRLLINLAPRAKRDLVQLTEATGRLMEAEAKARVPVDTGKLRQSITYEPIKGGLGAALSANAPYWPYVEFGTGGMVEVPEGFEDLAGGFKGSGKRTINRAAQPFLIPAYRKYADQYYEKVQERLNRIFQL